ncbi:ATP-dependent zinc metalloprotease FtsH [bacterium]|nr:ATP-dependent zinc metalloprotease FtsH [bacterium]
MNTFLKNISKNTLAIVLVLLVIIVIFAQLVTPQGPEKEKPFNQLIEAINQEKIEKIIVSDTSLVAYYKGGEVATFSKESGVSIFEIFKNLGVDQEKLSKVKIEIKNKGNDWMIVLSIFASILPFLFLIWLFWTLSKQAKMGAAQAFDFSKAKARLFRADQTKEKVGFDDVAGLQEVKEELEEVVDFLKNPQKYLKMGAKIPKGVLLVGPPGTGKTLLARAVAYEAGVPFFSISGSEFVEMFVGVGASRVRDLFNTAKKHQPSIIFIDELDAIGRIRGAGIGGGHDEREQTLNQILVEMDGFEKETAVIVIAATNRPDILDPALLRPGRFDRRIVLDLPDIKSRESILKIHCRNKPLGKDVDLREIAERTPGFSGADLANLVNEAAILAAKRNKKHINQQEFLEAFEKVLLGPEKKSVVFTNKEKKISAYHEAGHALVAMSLPNAEPVRKVSIVARGMAAGYTLKLPKEDKHIKTRKEFLDELAALLGGYCAEKIVFKDISTGASNDLEVASELARKLVKTYGMSDKLGPVVFGKKEELIFLGKELAEERNYSEKLAELIDEEVIRLIKKAQKQAEEILKRKRKTLDKIAKALLEKETLEKEELAKIVKSSSKRLKSSSKTSKRVKKRAKKKVGV